MNSSTDLHVRFHRRVLELRKVDILELKTIFFGGRGCSTLDLVWAWLRFFCGVCHVFGCCMKKLGILGQGCGFGGRGGSPCTPSKGSPLCTKIRANVYVHLYIYIYVKIICSDHCVINR